jgi:hypothetical protein
VPVFVIEKLVEPDEPVTAPENVRSPAPRTVSARLLVELLKRSVVPETVTDVLAST